MFSRTTSCYLFGLLFCAFATTVNTFVVLYPTERPSTWVAVSRYGPPSSDGSYAGESRPNVDDESRNNQKHAFRELLEQSMVVTDPEHLPRLLANNMDLIMSLQGEEGVQVITELVEEAKEEGVDHFDRTVGTVETILAFAEDFVNQASEMDSQNKHLLGKIMQTMTDQNENDRDKEELLDKLMEDEKDSFTPGFLRHLDGECDRIANAPKMTPDSARLLEIMRIIQTRVLEELGKDMGEAAVVLGQLMGYDDENELLGVLEAGLTVRGAEFAVEMSALTKEALAGFKRVPGGVDPELVERVCFIDTRVSDFLGDDDAFQ